MKIFNAIPSPLFSAAAELRPLTPISATFASVPNIVRISDPLVKSCSIHPRRLTPSDSLEERIVMAKSSMIASTIPKSPIHHGNRDAYETFHYLYRLNENGIFDN
jgi:hypothetical protein